ncbi:UbiH/UbiF/VisC/COQ6 family ubiquinone biosynthesis hydroxylase [Cochlodiniinecator piscidefendens]|uniref:UbiH/UbiF/VisC/COQ6 family ubiquinone biosynthesis hydroxylase n=1 Tax=Cochlodiniinecator piscidefendens TaxID=2715756 RepID=UPI00140E8A20|nr:UbiH/UbiF/VisC/COQ6 family ubiquinone biosynthesis hydroxylase [Cochlodiniinecator piscidefendens]
MTYDSDILIVGGGLNGPALALALADGGFTVTVIDAQPKQNRATAGFDGRGYALALASQRLLSAISVWGHVAQKSQPILEIKITDGRAGEAPSPWMLHFDHAEIEEGPMGYMLEDRYLYTAFLEAMTEHPRITHLDNEKVIAQDVSASGTTVTLASGTQKRGRLLVGSDGRRSSTAERAGIGRRGWDYGQTALVCAIKHEKAHHGIAHQFFMPPGPLAILPLPDNRVSIVWSEETKTAEKIQAMTDDAYMDVLRPRFGDFLGDISLAGERFTYPLNLTIAKSFTANRLALIGDAAHGVHPIAGQGLNLGLRDVGALAEVLIEARRRGEDIGAEGVLTRYEQWRRWDVETLVAATDTFNKLFSNDNGLLRAVRDIGLGVVNALPGARRSFIREAAGLTGDLPKLLQGRQI